ncbi:MAG: FlgD immunoglobulin-like domain containing protein [bacterium]|nr:FlgD immunoglobulin-like domain containing protein [bacterium]
MKKLIAIAAVFVLLLVASVNLSASQRVVVAEDFTGTWCQYCPAAANGLEQLHEETGDSLLVLAYHYGDPYQTTETYNRIVYYGAMIPGYPTVIFGGLDSIVGSSGSGAAYTNYDYYRPVFDVHKTVSSPFEITMIMGAHDLTARTGTIGVKIKNSNSVSESGTLHFAVMERNIPVIWQGMTEIDYTVRDMIPDENGQSITIPAGDSVLIIRNFTLDPSWVLGKCQFAAFVQRADKQIIQGSHLYGTCLVQQSYTMTETGDGDGFYEPGESLNLSVKVKNMYAPNSGAVVEAVTADTFITLTNNLWNIGSMGVGDSSNNEASPFLIGVKSSASMPEGHSVTIYINKKIYSSLYGDTLTVTDSVQFKVGTPALIYTENFESGLGNWLAGYTTWTAGVDWDTTTAEYHSPSICITNAKNINYANTQNRWIRMLTPLDLTGYSTAILTWYEKYDVVSGDKCQPEISTDSSGALWSALMTSYNGTETLWNKRMIDISTYCSNKKYFRIGFRLQTDAINTAKGWSVDDIAISGYLKTGVEGEPVMVSTPVSHQLFNSYPNPTRKMSNISYQLSSNQLVKLNIYDITGRLVKNLTDEKQAPGKYQLTWDGTDNRGRRAASGVYFYSLQTTEGRLSKKLIFLK